MVVNWLFQLSFGSFGSSYATAHLVSSNLIQLYRGIFYQGTWGLFFQGG